MSASQSLAQRQPANLETLHNILGSLVARYRQEEVLTAVRQIPARDAQFRPVPGWVTSALSEAYRAKGIQELYSHQASTAELVRNGKNVVVVTPTASGKTLCYNLPVLNAVLENPDTRALYLFPTKALAQDQLAELQDLAKRLDDSFGVLSSRGPTGNPRTRNALQTGEIAPGAYREIRARFDRRMERLERKNRRPLLDSLAIGSQARRWKRWRKDESGY